MKGEKEGGIRLREIERERETRRRRRRVKKNDDDDVVFFCALCSHHRRRRPQRERYKNTSSLSTFPHLTCEKRRLFNAFFFPKNKKKGDTDDDDDDATRGGSRRAAKDQHHRRRRAAHGPGESNADRDAIARGAGRGVLSERCERKTTWKRRTFFFSFATTFDFEF